MSMENCCGMMLNGNFNGQAGASAGPGINRQAASENARALGYSAETVAESIRLGRAHVRHLKAAPVVPYRDRNAVAQVIISSRLDHHGGFGRTGMFEHVVNRLLHDA